MVKNCRLWYITSKCVMKKFDTIYKYDKIIYDLNEDSP